MVINDVKDLEEVTERILELVDLPELRRKRQLHPAAEARLKVLLAKVCPEGYSLPEAWGIAGAHRSDLVLNLQDRRVAHFEIFGHKSTVARDANMLLMSTADVRVALIFDEEDDPEVAEAYFRTFPDNRFDWCKLSRFLNPRFEAEALVFLEKILSTAVQLGGPLTGRKPTASVSPPSGTPFSRAIVRVTGFHPDRDFTVFWDPKGTTSLIGSGRDISSEGSGECSVLIPHGGLAGPGTHQLRVVDSLGNVATTEYEINLAWPTPYLRVVPVEIKPGMTLTLIGAGAPADCYLTVFLWRGNRGDGIGRVKSDSRGEFSISLEFPWLVNLVELLKSGRHRLSVTPEEGGFMFDAHTYLEVQPFLPPGTVEWTLDRSMKTHDIALIRPHYQVTGKFINVSLWVRNDRQSAVTLAPLGHMSLLEFTESLQQLQYGFDCIEASTITIDPDSEAFVSFKFLRNFDSLPCESDALLHPMRRVTVTLPFLTLEEGMVLLQLTEIFPIDIWCSVEGNAVES